jgi:hypothetical protein
MNRLPYGYNLCHIYFYEKMSFYLHKGINNQFSNYTGSRRTQARTHAPAI